MIFKLASDYQPTGDQPQAIEKLVASIGAGNRYQTLLGVTGSGKTFTMANVIAQCDRPVLIICHNKTLATTITSRRLTKDEVADIRSRSISSLIEESFSMNVSLEGI